MDIYTNFDTVVKTVKPIEKESLGFCQLLDSKENGNGLLQFFHERGKVFNRFGIRRCFREKANKQNMER